MKYHFVTNFGSFVTIYQGQQGKKKGQVEQPAL